MKDSFSKISMINISLIYTENSLLWEVKEKSRDVSNFTESFAIFKLSVFPKADLLIQWHWITITECYV